MSYIFYNPETTQNPGTILKHIHPVNMSDKFAELKLLIRKPYATREDAVSENSSCFVYFYENGILYEALRIGEWQWKPCTEVECDHGINWNTYYAPTIAKLCKHLVKIYGTLHDFEPTLNAYGLYEIQVHYDGRCR